MALGKMDSPKIRVLQPAKITQKEIEELMCLENQLLDLGHRRDRLARDLTDRVASGAATEPGIYRLELAEKATPGRRVAELFIG